MFKWLAISAIVLMMFLAILLALGYFLQQNEKTTKALKQQFDQQRLARLKINQKIHSSPIINRVSESNASQSSEAESSASQSSASVNNRSVNAASANIEIEIVDNDMDDALIPDEYNRADQPMGLQQQIIAENLICVTDAQCVAFNADKNQDNCYLAVNSIGAAKLSKIQGFKQTNQQCLIKQDEVLVKCIKNLCTLD